MAKQNINKVIDKIEKEDFNKKEDIKELLYPDTKHKFIKIIYTDYDTGKKITKEVKIRVATLKAVQEIIKSKEYPVVMFLVHDITKSYNITTRIEDIENLIVKN